MMSLMLKKLRDYSMSLRDEFLDHLTAGSEDLEWCAVVNPMSGSNENNDEWQQHMSQLIPR